MDTENTMDEVHARLVGAYWLDSPYLHHPQCCCSPVQPSGRVSVMAVGLACLLVTLAVAVALA